MRKALSFAASAPIWLALIFFSVEAVGGSAVTDAADPNHGKNPAAKLCSNCHLVGSTEQQHANVDIPSFAEIANQQYQSAGAIMAAIMLPKHPMPTIPLTKSELAALATYIITLRTQE
jgi:mono/diheme cytochrome c family protein